MVSDTPESISTPPARTIPVMVSPRPNFPAEMSVGWPLLITRTAPARDRRTPKSCKRASCSPRKVAAKKVITSGVQAIKKRRNAALAGAALSAGSRPAIKVPPHINRVNISEKKVSICIVFTRSVMISPQQL